MAQYKVPPDPRDPDAKVNKEKSPREPIPWLWLGLGVLVTIIGLGIAGAIVSNFLTRPPLDVQPLTPTVIVLTAPPSPTPSATPLVPTPTAIPTLTPIPTPDTAVAPENITINYYAEVANTDGIGVTIRGGPSINNVAILIAPEGSIVYVLDGPAEGNDLLWWNVQLEDGTEGWAASDYLIPAAAP